METQKIVNLLNDTDNESPRFATKKWYVINDQNNTEYGEGNENDSSINLRQKLSSQVFPISQMHIFFVTGDITATGGDPNTKVAFKNCAPFRRCVPHINV